MRKPLVMGNWKMNASFAEAKTLCETVKLGVVSGVEVAVFPPAPYLSFALGVAGGSGLGVGAQNLSEYKEGAYTGEVSASMLKDLGCQYALIGHSERRAIFGETDVMVLGKIKQAVAEGLTIVLCVGETLEDRKGGRLNAVIKKQVADVLAELSEKEVAGLVIAYEPVWAIGTGLAATPDQVQEAHALIRETVGNFNSGLAKKTRIVYGGSLKSANAKEIFSLADVDGGLIGGASLIGDEFVKIIRLAV
ncbi:triose-phosphate isomerase [Francisellaceae bacterium]|nr:triose-phosphate isomerase [Francisellaceae bacterium]